jgi:membrane-bound lytic murein transglycosylase D
LRLLRKDARPRASRIALLSSILLLLAVASGCAGSHKPPATTPGQAVAPGATAPAPVATEKALTDAEKAQTQQAMERAERALEPAENAGDAAQEAAEEQASSDVADAEPEDAEPSPLDELPETTPDVPPAEIAVERGIIEAAAPAFDIPMVVNDDVLAWVNYFTTRHKDRFEEALVRSGRYLPMIHRIFEEEGLPKDLAYMAHVESAWKVNAYSRAKAKGIFQFIASTGRRYGLRIDSWVDERSDPEKAARAAAAYLRDLHAMFGDWYLALAGYNAGEGKVSRGLARTGQADFWTLKEKRGALRKETQNYVPAILAATLISKSPGRYGFDFDPDDALSYDTIVVDNAVSLSVLARCAGTDAETLKALNPALRRQQTPPGSRTDVRVPPGTAHATLAALELVPAKERITIVYHKVRKGETVATVARRYGFSTSEIRQANHLGKRGLRAGETLVIPGAGIPAAERASSSKKHARPAPGTVASYRVQRGDTLYGIAKQFRTTPQAIAAASGISIKTRIKVGDKLRIPGKGAPVSKSTDVASVRSGPKVHTVVSGETLWRIADRYRTTVEALCSLNHISKHDAIIPGMRLTIRTE